MGKGRVILKAVAIVALLMFVSTVSHTMRAQPSGTSAKPSRTDQRQTPTPTPEISRWIEFDTINFSDRYRTITTANGNTIHQNQFQVTVRGRFKFDSKGRYSINGGLFSGNNITGGWNNTGWGTGDLQSNLYLKQLYFSAKPVKGLEIQFGGIAANNGLSTEVTGYDNDLYLMGERVVIRRPKELYFDEISVTYAYLGDVNRPNVFRRFKNLDKSNYHQFLVRKQLSSRAALSADYTFESGRDTVHWAVRVKIPETRVVDFALFESYHRVSPDSGYGFHIYGERAVTERFTLNGGFARIDAPMFNADRFPPGKRLYLGGSYRLNREFTFTGIVIQGVGSLPNAQTPRRRVELILTYSFLETLRRLKLL